MKQTKFGSISGLTEKLDYIQDLGVESIWLSPIYEFGGVDYGNDITDHKKIDPLFGTEDDFEALLREVDKRGEYYLTTQKLRFLYNVNYVNVNYSVKKSTVDYKYLLYFFTVC